MRTVNQLIATIRELEHLDWDFKKIRLNGVNSLHWFPASYIPQIPSLLIASLSKPGDVVLDPFCGSGTTLVEAARIGRTGLGIDSNALATLITKVKITYINPEYLARKLTRLLDHIKKIGTHQILIPDFPNKENWFHKDTLRQLGKIFFLIERENDRHIRDFLRVCFSSILKKCSSQKDHYTYVADNMFTKDISATKYVDAIEVFSNVVKRNYRALIDFYDEIKLQDLDPGDVLVKCKVYNCDSRNKHPFNDENVDLVVTSPPYANVTDYTTGNRLSFYWLNHDIFNSSKEIEIGARWKRARRTSMEDYIKDMFLCLCEINRVLKKNSFFCCVLGETSSLKKQANPRDEIVNLAAGKLNFELISNNITRNIYAKRIRAVRGVNKEHVLIFRKGN